MNNTRHFSVLAISFLIAAVLCGTASGDWPMAGANPQRTSWVSEDLPGNLDIEWIKPIEAYIPQRAQIIGAENKVFISTAHGLYALNTNTAEVAWIYPTELPLGHSASYDNGRLYVAGMDKKIHAISAANGTAIWTFTAGAGFSTSPLVVNGTVYLGCRDSRFYAVNAADGLPVWDFETDGPILYSAAYFDGEVYFGSQDGYAYALDAVNGSLVWQTKLIGRGFRSWWPVVYGDYVIYTRSTILSQLRDEGNNWLFTDQSEGNLPGILGNEGGDWVSGMPTLDLRSNPHGNTMPDYFENYSGRENILVIDRSTGQKVDFDLDSDGVTDAGPMMWCWTHAGTCYPPIVSGYNNVLYLRTMNHASGGIPGAMVVGWKFGTPYISCPVSGMTGNSGDWPSDEPVGFSAAGNDIFWNLCNERFVGQADISVANSTFPSNDNSRQWRYASGWPYPKDGSLPDDYNQQIFQYMWMDPFEEDRWYFAHGDNVGPIVYDGRMYVFRGNSVIAWSAAGGYGGVEDAAAIQQVTDAAADITKADLEQILADEVQKILDAGHLKPAVGKAGLADHIIDGIADAPLDYFHNPADIIITLLKALDHLPVDMVGSVETYIQDEFSNFPPYQYSHIGYASGSRRRDWDRAWYPSFGPRSGNYSGFNLWNIPPHNFYAMWKYAERFGGALSIYNSSKSKLASLPTEAELLRRPQVHNSFIAGYKGFLELEALAGEPESTQVAADLDYLLQLRGSNFTANLAYNSGSAMDDRYYFTLYHAYNFMHLVPELADYLKQNSLAAVENCFDELSHNAPYWPEGLNAEAQGENGVTPYQQTHALYQAKAQLLDASFEELAKYLDAPMCLGDLYYIDNLISALESPGSVLCATGEAELSGALDDTTAYQAGADAAAIAENELGGNEAKLVLVSDNLGGHRQAMLNGIASVFDANVIYGCTSYQALTEASNQMDVGLVAMAGEIEVHSHVEDMSPAWNPTEATGEAIATALEPYVPTTDRESLLLLLGWMHTPDHNAVTTGAKNILGDDFLIAGNSGAPVNQGSLFVYSQGMVQVTGRNVMGILLNGDFELGWAFNEAADSNDSIVESAQMAIRDAIDGDANETQMVFAFDCGSRRDGSGNAYPAELDAMSAEAEGIPLFGFYGSGEIGRDYPGDQPSYGVNKHISAVAIKAKTLAAQSGVPPVADIVADVNSGAPPFDVNFDGSGSSDFDGSIESYHWDFGDGNTADTSSPQVSHTYSTDGQFAVELTVTDDDGMTDTASLMIYSGNRPPTAVISANPIIGIPPVDVDFDGSGSSDADGTIVSWEWDFGDESPTAAGATVSHTYTDIGVYTVTLTVTDDYGDTGEDTVEITVSETLPVPTDYTAYYKLDETSDTTAHDESANGYDGSLVGACTWNSDGKVDGCLHIDRVSTGRVDIANFNQDTAAVTAACWVNLDDISEWTHFVVGPGVSFTLMKVDNHKVQWRVDLDGVRKSINSPDTEEEGISEGQWQHWAGTWDGTTSRLYKNGAEVASSALTGELLQIQSMLRIGNAGGSSLDGRIDEVRIYGRALVPEEIEAIYSESQPSTGDVTGDGKVDFRDYAAMAAYWLGNEGTVDIVLDGVIDGEDLAVMAGNWLMGYAPFEPVLDAGADQSITLPDNTVSLAGVIVDDGLPAQSGQLSVQWSKKSGVGNVVFGDPCSLSTSATFDAAGVYVLEVTGDNGHFTGSDTVQITVEPESVPIGLPGRLEVEDYKNGGEGVAYHDTTAGNLGNATEFTDDVDVANCSEGGYNVGYINSGEWIKYDVDISEAGPYTVTGRVASDWDGNRSLRIQIDGSDVATVSFTNSAGDGWQTYKDAVTTDVYLTTGQHELTLYMDSGDFNLNYVDFVLAGN